MRSRAEQGTELQRVQNGMRAGEGEQRRLSVMPGNYARKQNHEAVDNPTNNRTNVRITLDFCAVICYNNDQYKGIMETG